MRCEVFAAQLQLYLDDELSVEQARRMEEHLPGCSQCTAALAATMRLKRGVRLAGKQFKSSDAFRKKMEHQLSSSGRRSSWLGGFGLRPLAAGALALMLLVVLSGLWWKSARADAQLSELIDLHVSTLASQFPVDVQSEDRHTVKPWFQGRIPFSFNIPELNGTPFSLIGGRVVYLHQTAGAQLLYAMKQHKISVLVFQDRAGVGDDAGRRNAVRVSSWTKDGLRYFVISDADQKEVAPLAELLKAAN
ncbi:MAG: zf-HC2 domain-containing protein [Acidobacteriaceae bacterium]